ncbi:hypothetical protein PUNSTDRAFT_139540 [Punctularia strigosozonata HHB-11173 SS5]|uniref:Uncharacterized protein n=1 Tax=Punctularia strigosozonata (strain HHB-11173) TaxID=741275 RepID=R7S0S2_PUNST|nr:uncharacterized protein PUNSTDRAFT_139540 [Punctularia strigosozonata HHB-11173 SS5]EIN03449.1 hypothetical protein PUNSTDRAFT_139540 [Punctularia strigosozonata HHB-11173 SS5]
MPARSYTALKRAGRLQALHDTPLSPDVASDVNAADTLTQEVFGLTVADDGIISDSRPGPLWASRQAKLPDAAISSTAHIVDSLNDVIRVSIPASDPSPPASAGAAMAESGSTISPAVPTPTGTVADASSTFTGHSTRFERRSDNLTRRAIVCLNHIEMDISLYMERKRVLDVDRSLNSFLELRDRLDRIKENVAGITRRIDAVIDGKRRVEGQLAVLYSELERWKDQIKLGPASCVYDSGVF